MLIYPKRSTPSLDREFEFNDIDRINLEKNIIKIQNKQRNYVLDCIIKRIKSELKKVKTVKDLLKIKIYSSEQLDSHILARLLGRYATLKGLAIKEFDDEYLNFYEKPKQMIKYLTEKEPILKKDLEKIAQDERQKYFWTVKAQSLEVTKSIQKS